MHDSIPCWQTLTGGLRLTRCPWYAVVWQLLLFATPAAIVAVAVTLEQWHRGMMSDVFLLTYYFDPDSVAQQPHNG